jgi:hypothetical protein
MQDARLKAGATKNSENSRRRMSTETSAIQKLKHPGEGIPKGRSRQVREFDSRGAKWDFGLDENRGVGRVLRKPHPQSRVG